MKEMFRIWPLTASLFLLFIGIGLSFIQECQASKLITFEGTFIQHPKFPPYEDDSVTHTFALEKDGVVTVTVIFDPRDPRNEDKPRTVWTTIYRPKDLCEIYSRKSSFSEYATSGKISDPIPLAAGQHEIDLSPHQGYREDDGIDSSYTVYINYTTSDPSTDDNDPCIGYHQWGCPPDQLDDWGTLTNNSTSYSHLGYQGCLTDHDDRFYFKVAQTGTYYFSLQSRQIDVTGCYETAKYGGRFSKLSGFPHSSFYVFKLEGNRDFLYKTIGPLSLVKGEQYELVLSAYAPAPYFDPKHCFAAVEFQLIREFKPVTITKVEHTSNSVCGITEEITVTVNNPNNVAVSKYVPCYMSCPRYKDSVGKHIKLAPGRSTDVTLSWPIPRSMLNGTCDINCSISGSGQSSTMNVLCDKKLNMGALYMLLFRDGFPAY